MNLIKQHRGSVEIINPEGLAAASCDCYEIVNAYADRVSGPSRL
jgi:hypothetical protein